MREMDLLMTGWVARHWDAANENVREDFLALQDEIDQDILDWVLERRPTPGRYGRLVEELRDVVGAQLP